MDIALMAESCSRAQDVVELMTSDGTVPPVDIRWSATRVSYHKYSPRTQEHQITFGYESLIRANKEGFREYSTIASVWDGCTIGSVEREALHELAHVIQAVRGYRTKGVAHDYRYAGCLYELRIRYEELTQ